MAYQLYSFLGPLIMFLENPVTWVVLAVLTIIVSGMFLAKSHHIQAPSGGKLLRVAAGAFGFACLVSANWIAPTLIDEGLDAGTSRVSQFFNDELYVESDEPQTFDTTL